MLCAQSTQHFGHRLAQGFVVDTDQLALNAGGIGHRAENIKNCAQAQLATRANSVFHGTVVGRCKHKADTQLLHTEGYLLRA